MTIACPCCRAANEEGPLCRRCKADLSLLFALESQCDVQLAESKRSLRVGDIITATTHLQNAERLRVDDESRKLRAITALVNRDFPQAFATLLEFQTNEIAKWVTR